MHTLPPWLNAALFAVAAAAIWWAGARLEKRAATLSERTGMGEAFAGMLLLAAATSLPELATTITAVVLLRNPTLAVHNLLGGVAFQTLIIAIADAAQRRRRALTASSPTVALLIQGVGLVLLLQIVAAGLVAKGTPVVFSTSGWLLVLLLGYFAMVFLVNRSRGRRRWKPTSGDPAQADAEQDQLEGSADPRSNGRLWLAFSGLSVVVLGGGFLATQTAEALAGQTGMGAAFMGATLLAAATSLPEVSTTISAVRSKRFTAAISNVFGSNAFDVTLLLLAELLHREASVLADAAPSALFVALLGAAMTCIYLWGLIEREDRTLFRVGLDSVAAVLVYLGGMTVLYFIQ